MPPFLPRKRLRSASPTVEEHAEASRKKGKIQAISTPTRRPTLFDDLDAGIGAKHSAAHKKAILEKLAASDDDESSLTSLSDSELEDVPITKRQAEASDDADEDEDIEFEDVETHAAPGASENMATGDLELTLTKDTRISITNPMGNKKGPSKIERQIRISTHQCHVQFLMFHNAVRNAWLCDKDLQNLLVDQLPPAVVQAVEKWRKDSGITSAPTAKANGKAKKNKGKKADVRSQRDWGEPAFQIDQNQVNMSGGDPLFRLLKHLVHYWLQRFRIIAPGIRKVGYMSLQRLDEELKSFQPDGHDLEQHGERFKNVEEFKHSAECMEGSRDTGAQLFTALLRGIGLEARMVASLQPVGFGWSQVEEAAEKNPRILKKPKLHDKSKSSSDDESEDEEEDTPPIKSARKSQTEAGKAATNTRHTPRRSATRLPAPASSDESVVEVKVTPASQTRKHAPAKLQQSTTKSRAKAHTNGRREPVSESDESVIDVTPAARRTKPSLPYDKDLLFPHYWTEVLSPVTNTYIPVDALVLQTVASNQQLIERFEPRGGKTEKAKQVIAYVIGHSSDGTAKDVTTRYLKNKMWPGRTKGFRYPAEKIAIHDRNGRVKRYEHKDWFKMVLSGYVRGATKYPRTATDDHEEVTDLKPAKREKKEVEEGKETLQYYKSSPQYVLARHLKREEALLPTAKHVKLFAVGKGDSVEQEKVFLRKDVVHCKSTETWHKEGRAPKPGEEPLKHVPFRAATTNRKRELAEAEHASGEKMLQPLFSRAQTEWIIPPPIEDGIIPKNAFGNIDLYVESMLPEGAAHIPYRGTVKICKRLEIDYAEAVTGFEFGRRMAVPVIEGVVIAEEHFDAVMKEWKEDEKERQRKEDEKRTKTAINTWRKMLMGLRIVERVREEYGDLADDNADLLNPFHKKSKISKEDQDAEAQKRIMDQVEEETAGGFLPEGFDVEDQVERRDSSFFPVIHEDDEEDEGGGFVVEGHAASNAGIASPVQIETDISDLESHHVEQPTTRQRGRPKGSAKQPGVRKDVSSAAGKRRTASSDKASDIEDSMSDEKVTPAPKRRGRPASTAKIPKSKPSTPASSKAKTKGVGQKSVVATRQTPRRAAARSQTGVKSKYFEQSEEEEDDEDEED